ncbi:MAG: hypothetical protein HZA24_11620 [Nitrospirae bacterium]|nr:hypothetical protein [Nitrospirota bacterium]
MLRDKRFIAVLAVALLMAVGLNVRYFASRHHPRPAATQMVAPMGLAEPEMAHAAAPPALSPADQVAAWNARYPLGPGARNPFAAGGSRAEPEKVFAAPAEKNPGEVAPRLAAIANIDGNRLALIDGEPLRENDTLGNIHVIHIGTDRVTVTAGGRHRTLTLPGLPTPPVAP